MTADAVCGIGWPVCPNCLGHGLPWSASRAWCRWCGGTWHINELVPCPGAATVILAGPDDTAMVCPSHAAHPSADLLTKVYPDGARAGVGT